MLSRSFVFWVASMMGVLGSVLPSNIVLASPFDNYGSNAPKSRTEDLKRLFEEALKQPLEHQRALLQGMDVSTLIDLARGFVPDCPEVIREHLSKDWITYFESSIKALKFDDLTPLVACSSPENLNKRNEKGETWFHQLALALKDREDGIRMVSMLAPVFQALGEKGGANLVRARDSQGQSIMDLLPVPGEYTGYGTLLKTLQPYLTDPGDVLQLISIADAASLILLLDGYTPEQLSSQALGLDGGDTILHKIALRDALPLEEGRLYLSGLTRITALMKKLGPTSLFVKNDLGLTPLDVFYESRSEWLDSGLNRVIRDDHGYGYGFNSCEMEKLILELPTDVLETQFHRGRNFFHYAAFCGDLRSIRTLTKRISSRNTPESSNPSDPRVLKLLLAITEEGQTVAHFLARSTQLLRSEYPEKSVISALMRSLPEELRQRADVNGNTPLHLVAGKLNMYQYGEFFAWASQAEARAINREGKTAFQVLQDADTAYNRAVNARGEQLRGQRERDCSRTILEALKSVQDWSGLFTFPWAHHHPTPEEAERTYSRISTRLDKIYKEYFPMCSIL